MDEDTVGVIQLVVPNLSQLSSLVTGESKSLHGLPWRLTMICQDVTSSSQGTRGKALGVFLQCIPDQTTLPADWSVSVHATLTLVNQLDPPKSYTKRFDHCYCAKSTDWGYSSFMKWKDVTDTSKGYLKSDTIILQAHIGVNSTSQSARLRDKEVSVLACPICRVDFQEEGKRQPMSLKCGHTFCLGCLQKCSSTADDVIQIKCPDCNQEHSSSKEAKLWFPNHSVIQIIGNVIPKSKHFCTKHQHDQTYYCFDDQTLVCIYCAYHGDHSSHECVSVEEARKRKEDTLQEVKLQASSKVMELERGLLLLKDEQQRLKSQEENVSRLVESFFGSIVAALQTQKEQLLQELCGHTADISGTLERHISKLEGKATDMRAALDKYSTWLSLPPRDALHQSQAFQSTLRSIATRCDDLQSVSQTTTKISFEAPCSDVLTSLGHLGRFIVTQKHGEEQQRTGKNLLLKGSKEHVSDSYMHESRDNVVKDLEGQPPTKKRKDS